MKFKSLFSILAMVVFVSTIAVTGCKNSQPTDQNQVKVESADVESTTVAQKEGCSKGEDGEKCTGQKEGCCKDKAAKECKSAENKEGGCCKDKAGKECKNAENKEGCCKDKKDTKSAENKDEGCCKDKAAKQS